ncbi:CH033 protein, partial [Urocolius indicus]|nr:CH033 protein [Urocolius indicus]
PPAGSVPKEDRSQPEAAPGDQTVTEAATAGGDAQKKKKKKKKQKPSVSEAGLGGGSGKAKAEATRSQNEDASQQDETSQQSDDQLQKEVDWCVEQLELGLKTQKPTPRQAEEALRAIRTLRSHKAPLVKKRQLMRTMFGDYRKKMEEELAKELRQVEAALRCARIMEVQRSIRRKSGRFIRRSLAARRESQGAAGCPAEPPRTLLTTSQQELQLHFS